MGIESWLPSSLHPPLGMVPGKRGGTSALEAWALWAALSLALVTYSALLSDWDFPSSQGIFSVRTSGGPWDIPTQN